jgi:hypothetical protein
MNPFYNILAKLNAVTSTTPVETAKPTETVYESVEARGSITEAVRALEAKFATFKESTDAKPARSEFKKEVDYFQALAYFYAEVAEKSSGQKRKEADELSAKYQGKVEELDDLNESVADDIADKKAEKEAGDWWGDKKASLNKDKREVKGSKYGGSKQKDDDEAKDKDDKKDAQLSKKSNKTAILDKDDEEDLDESFEFGSKNFKNASNLKKAPKAKLVKESAVRNHPIYTNPEAWDHYKKELDEEELNKATQELDEISKLAGLPKQINVDMNKPLGAPAKADGVTLPPAPIEQEPMLEIDDETDNEWDDESGYDLDDPKHPTWAERQREKAEWARDYARDSALDESSSQIGDVIECPGGVTGEIIADLGNKWLVKDLHAETDDDELEFNKSDCLLDEAEMEEGNEFSGALASAKASGAKDFEVAGKKYTVKEDINVSVTANGEEDALNLFRKLAGMPQIAIAQSEEPCDGAMEIEVDEERDPEYVNSPREQVAPLSAAIPSGNDLHRSKRQYKKEYPGDNPMAVAESKKDTSWDKYTSILKGLTK